MKCDGFMFRARPAFLSTLCMLLLSLVVLSYAESAGATVGQRREGVRPVDSGAIPSSYFVGTWETRNIEFGRDVTIIWTVRGDGSLDYDFVVDGVASRGSSGTWTWDGTVLEERWQRSDGSEDSGKAAIERIDENTLRLTILHNGHSDYAGKVRIYRRRHPPQTVLAPPFR